MDSRLIVFVVALWLIPALALADVPQRSSILAPVLDAAVSGDTWLILDEAYNRGLKVSTPDTLYSLSGGRLQAICATRLDGLCLCFYNSVYRLDGITPAQGDTPARLDLTWLLDAPVPAGEQVRAFSRDGGTWLFTTKESVVAYTPGDDPVVAQPGLADWLAEVTTGADGNRYGPGGLACGGPAPCLLAGEAWLASSTTVRPLTGGPDRDCDFSTLLSAEPFGVRFQSTGEVAAAPLGGSWFAYDGPDPWFLLNGAVAFGRDSLDHDRLIPALVAVCPRLGAAELIKCGPASGIPWLLVDDGATRGLLTVEIRERPYHEFRHPYNYESSARTAWQERFDRPFRFTFEALTFQAHTYVAGYTSVKHTATDREHPVAVLAPPVSREYERFERAEYGFDRAPGSVN